MKRQLIYVKDAMIITGKGNKYCYQLFKKIKEKYGKEPNEKITYYEFCQYCKIDYDMFMKEREKERE